MTSTQTTTEKVNVRLSDLIAPVFYPLHKAIKRGTHSEFWIKGGRCSTKSSVAALEIVHGMMSDPEANAIVFRKVSDTIRTSVFESCIWAIEKLEVEHLWRGTVSPAELTYIPTGQKIIFRGLDKPTKIKSIRLRKGYFKFSWFEELEEFNGMEEIRNASQSIIRGGQSYVRFFTYNPPIFPNSWVNTEAALVKENRYVHHSTYEDIPPEWLGEEFFKEVLWLKENNPIAYAHEYLGVPTGINDAIVFAGKTSIRDFTPKEGWLPYYGADWGFSQDPTCLLKVWIEETEEGRYRLYIEHEAFGKGVEMDELPELFDQVPDSRKYKIMADCSRPETIAHVKRKGFNIEGAPKWQGSVEDGIEVMKSFVEIVIHPRCKNAQEEFRLYTYRIDKMTKEVTSDIVDKYNHGIDAIRYALSKYIKRRGKGRFSI